MVGIGVEGGALDVLCVGTLGSIVDCRRGVRNYEIGFNVGDEGVGEYNFILLLVRLTQMEEGK